MATAAPSEATPLATAARVKQSYLSYHFGTSAKRADEVIGALYAALAMRLEHELHHGPSAPGKLAQTRLLETAHEKELNFFSLCPDRQRVDAKHRVVEVVHPRRVIEHTEMAPAFLGHDKMLEVYYDLMATLRNYRKSFYLCTETLRLELSKPRQRWFERFMSAIEDGAEGMGLCEPVAVTVTFYTLMENGIASFYGFSPRSASPSPRRSSRPLPRSFLLMGRKPKAAASAPAGRAYVSDSEDGDAAASSHTPRSEPDSDDSPREGPVVANGPRPHVIRPHVAADDDDEDADLAEAQKLAEEHLHQLPEARRPARGEVLSHSLSFVATQDMWRQRAKADRTFVV